MLLAVSTETGLVAVSVVIYASAAIIAVVNTRSGRPAAGVVATLIMAPPALLLIAISGRWIREGQGPFLTIYDVLLSNLCSLGLIFGLLYLYVPKIRISGIVVLPFLFFLGVWLINESPTAVPLPATFDNYWLWLHVLSGKLFLGFCLVGTALALLLLLNRFRSSKAHSPGPPPTRELDASVWQFMSIAFVCHSCMLVAGSVWAYSAWGRYWAWDPLETWSLITWLCLGATLHAKLTFSRMPAWSGWSMAVGVFILAFLTFFGVPFVSLAPHKGVM